MVIKGYRSLNIRLFSVISRTFVGGILPLNRDTVGVFYNPSRLGHLLREFYPSAEMQIVYSTALQLTGPALVLNNTRRLT